MQQKTGKNQVNSQNLERCAVIKIDLNGRFVYIDNRAEKILGAPAESLYGQNIKEFISDESYDLVSSIIHNSKLYESYYDATCIELIDKDKRVRFCNVVVSLNFIAGNPANYQIIILPERENIKLLLADDDLPESQEWLIPGFLFDYIASLDRALDWQKLTDILSESERIAQVGIYAIKDDKPVLLASSCQPTYIDKGYDLNHLDEGHLGVIQHKGPHICNGQGRFDGLTDACFPLNNGTIIWGLLRFIVIGEIDEYDTRFKALAAFIGNSLCSFGPVDTNFFVSRQSQDEENGQ